MTYSVKSFSGIKSGILLFMLFATIIVLRKWQIATFFMLLYPFEWYLATFVAFCLSVWS